MPGIIVVGAQWGDEGKGKVIDILAAKAKHVVRAQGGNNAGHTVLIGSEEYKLHLIPSGILHSDTSCYIGAGTVIDPEVLLQEIQGLESRGHKTLGRLWISSAAHVLFPYHRLLDTLLEKKKGSASLGTTGRGIGPCYADKANRLGIRMGEFTRADLFPMRLKDVLALKNAELTQLYGAEALPYESLLKECLAWADSLRPYVKEVEEAIHLALEKGDNVLFEGAQGTFLDLTLGTYPYVTSSNTIAGGICVGAGIGPSHLNHTLGVVKAYTTRVGLGPFPTEAQEHENFLDHKQAREFGTTTGRKRRIGWFDAVLAKTAVRLNGLQSLALTKLDILDTLENIKICAAYHIDGKPCHFVPSLASDMAKAVPIYETIPGWRQSTQDCTRYEELPAQAQHYIKKIEALCGVPVSILSVGPERSRTFILKDIFRDCATIP